MPQPALPPESILVFVYGTLRRGAANDINRLRPAPRFLGLAQANGTLSDLGAYPGMVRFGAGREVGEVYAIAPELESQLDAIEAAPPSLPDDYVKRRVMVCMENHTENRIDAPLEESWATGVDIDKGNVPCLMYEIHPRCVDGMPVIEGGDWLLR